MKKTYCILLIFVLMSNSVLGQNLRRQNITSSSLINKNDNTETKKTSALSPYIIVAMQFAELAGVLSFILANSLQKIAIPVKRSQQRKQNDLIIKALKKNHIPLGPMRLVSQFVGPKTRNIIKFDKKLFNTKIKIHENAFSYLCLFGFLTAANITSESLITYSQSQYPFKYILAYVTVVKINTLWLTYDMAKHSKNSVLTLESFFLPSFVSGMGLFASLK